MTAVHVAEVRLYLYDGQGDYNDMGDVGCALVVSPGTPPTFRLGCYRGDDYLCTAEVSPSNDTGLNLALQGQGYVSFRDDQSRLWSMHFPVEEEAYTLAAHVAAAMYGAANMPDNRIICCDVAQGKRERSIYGGDRVKVRYSSWVLSRDGGVPQLGSRLESNEHDDKPHAFDVPVNHNSVTKDMIGFEGMVVGMAEESRRLIVVPQAAKRGRGPAVHTVYMMYVVKKKENNFDDDGRAPRPSGQNQQGQDQHRDPMVADSRGGFSPQQPQQAQPQLAMSPYQVVAAQPVAAAPVVAAEPAPQQRAVVAQPAPVEQPAAAMPAPPPSGFNYEQMETLERLREQVGQLMVTLRDSTGKVDMFQHDFRTHDRKTKPPTLIAAQMDHSLRTLIEQTDQLKADLAKRDETLNSLEERNKQLQAKADRFAKTAQQLTEERKATIANSGETKIDLDQQMLSNQAKLTRVLADREDVGRHLATVKRLLEISDKDTREAKQQLQVAEVQLSTNEAKLASTDEALQEERARRKLLEAKVVTLGDEIRAIMDEFRTKDGQIDDRRRQMNAAKLHWQQMMDDERAQAASELREMRQELIDELAVRDRRYQEERARVAKEAFERGRHQGIEDGEKEELLDGDMKMQALQFDAQRHRSELETVRIMLRQVHEQAASDRRRLEAQIAALTRVVDDLDAQNGNMETELHSLEAAKETVAAAAYDEANAVLGKLTRPVGKKDLLTLIHCMRVKQDPDWGFEAVRAEEEAAVIEQEERQVVAWVRRCLTAVAGDASVNAFELPPSMRLLAPQEPPQREPPVVVADPDPQEPNTDAAAATAAVFDAQPSVDMAEVERRQKELLAALHANNPALELAPPPRDPTPTPPRSPTPEAEPEDANDEQASQGQAAEHDRESEQDQQEEGSQPRSGSSTRRASRDGHHPTQGEGEDSHSDRGSDAGPSAAENAREGADDADAHDDEHHSEHEAPVPAPRERADTTMTDATEESEAGFAPVTAAPAKRPAPKQTGGLFGDEDSDAEPAAPPAVAPKKAPAPKPAPAAFADTEDEDSSAFFRPAPKKAPVPAKQPPAKAPAQRHGALFGASDSDEEDASASAPLAPAPKKVPAPTAAGKRAPPTAGLFGGADSGSDSDGPVRAPAVLPTTKKAPAAAPGKKGLFFGSDDDDDDDGPLVVPKRPAAKPAKKAPAPKRSALFDSETEDE
eukprot:CAMPEP_0174838700 /NCGR_PEP_ID=MMETSP1114-20130205/7553_1 /TAXON_ID=312471 /ORGANISM="Neobodo designis, Strain CCAP 1951/1" /LENGTH=1199 /DNA_ID=CAMNT_0016072803 /DNA_START=54 /DNA_END=3653 /DNA_ORIENTATION=+